MARRDVILGAALEGDLELARQRRAERMAQENRVSPSAYGVTSKRFVGRHAGIRTRRDVPHRVAARLARGEARLGQPPHRRLDVVQLDEMKLDVLPRRDVAEPPRIPLADVGQRAQLIGS